MKQQEKKENTPHQFPESQGVSLSYFGDDVLSNGKSPVISIGDEVGIYPKTPKESYKSIELDLSDQAEENIGRGPSSTILSADDFYQELIKQPRVVQAEVLIKDDTIYTIRRVSPRGVKQIHIAGSDLTYLQKEIIVEKILGEYKSQGHGVAVAIDEEDGLFRTNLHKSYFGDDVERGDSIMAMGMALSALQVQNASLKPLIDIP